MSNRNSCKANQSIKCSVSQCANHCHGQDYCSLSSIQVGTHEDDPSMDQCTDCQSFEPDENSQSF